MYQLPGEDELIQCYKANTPRTGPLPVLEEEIENFVREELSLSVWVYIIVWSNNPERIRIEVFERGLNKTGTRIYSYNQLKDPELFLMYIAKDFLFS